MDGFTTVLESRSRAFYREAVPVKQIIVNRSRLTNLEGAEAGKKP